MVNKIAKFIRIVTVPPILIFMVLLILKMYCSYIFNNNQELLLSILFLAVLPIMVYPLHNIFSKFKGRNGERKLAFIVSFFGYMMAVIYGIIFSVSKDLLFIYCTYFVSVVFLAILNKAKIKASGHACSITGPLLIFVYFIGLKYIVLCLILLVLTYWASLRIKRHTIKELILGSTVCGLSFLINMLFFY